MNYREINFYRSSGEGITDLWFDAQMDEADAIDE